MDFPSIFNSLAVQLIQWLVVLLAIVVIKLVFNQIKVSSAKLTVAQREALYRVASPFVHAAEDYGIAGKISKIGADKKQWALEQITLALKAEGINFPVVQTEAIIEEIFRKEIKNFPFVLPDSTTVSVAPVPDGIAPTLSDPEPVDEPAVVITPVVPESPVVTAGMMYDSLKESFDALKRENIDIETKYTAIVATLRAITGATAPQL